jgi:hypothetical protein
MGHEEFSPSEMRFDEMSVSAIQRADTLADDRSMFVLWLVHAGIVETVEALRSQMGADFPAEVVAHRLIVGGFLLDRDGHLSLTAKGAEIVGLLQPRGALAWIARRADQLVSWAYRYYRETTPLALFIYYLIFAAGMTVATAVAGLAILRVPHNGRLKGFLLELNWGINHLFFIPASFAAIGLVFPAIRQVVKRMATSEIVVSPRDSTPVPTPILLENWHQSEVGRRGLSVILLLCFLGSYSEWALVSLLPNSGVSNWFLPEGGPAEYSWTVGHLINPAISPSVNVLLTFCFYTAQGFIASFYFYFYFNIIKFGYWLLLLMRGNNGNFIINNPLSLLNIKACAELFGIVILRILYAFIAISLVLLCIRIQSVYNLGGATDPTVFHFLSANIFRGMFAKLPNAFGGGYFLLNVFDLGVARDFSSVVVALSYLLVLAFILSVPALILAVSSRLKSPRF